LKVCVLKFLESVSCVGAVEAPELLPYGYLVGDVTTIAIALKGRSAVQLTQPMMYCVTLFIFMPPPNIAWPEA